jgi:SAM-dependent methyltransferase
VGTTRRDALIDSLRRTIEGLHWEPQRTEWADYDPGDAAGDAARAKDDLVRSMLRRAGGEVVWDLGANAGRHSAIAASLERRVVAWDADPAATERHYRRVRASGADILPLLADLANPSPAAGWGLDERASMVDRADADVVLALALVHHLAIGRNVPLARISAFLARLGPALIVEFVGRDDPMVRRLLATREDVFTDYHEAGFWAAFGRHWGILDEQPIPGTARTLFRMVRRG